MYHVFPSSDGFRFNVKGSSVDPSHGPRVFNASRELSICRVVREKKKLLRGFRNQGHQPSSSSGRAPRRIRIHFLYVFFPVPIIYPQTHEEELQQ